MNTANLILFRIDGEVGERLGFLVGRGKCWGRVGDSLWEANGE